MKVLNENIENFCNNIDVIVRTPTAYRYQNNTPRPTKLKQIVVEYMCDEKTGSEFSDLICYFVNKEDFDNCKNYFFPNTEEDTILLNDKLATYGIVFLEEKYGKDQDQKYYKLKLQIEANTKLNALKLAVEDSDIMTLFNTKSQRRKKNEYVLTLLSFINQEQVKVEKLRKNIANEIKKLFNTSRIIDNVANIKNNKKK